jgi:hypothetical protein
MSDLPIPTAGFQRAVAQINVTASKIAQRSLPSSSSSSTSSASIAAVEDTVDLSSNMVALLQNRLVAESNLKAFQSLDDIQKSLINAFG